MYMIDTDTYVCDCCGREYKWDGDEYGNIYECEECGKHFCADCFVKNLGFDDFYFNMNESEKCLCPTCFKNRQMNAERITHTVYHLIPDKRYKDGFRKVKLASGRLSEIEYFVSLARQTSLSKLGTFHIEEV